VRGFSPGTSGFPVSTIAPVLYNSFSFIDTIHATGQKNVIVFPYEKAG